MFESIVQKMIANGYSNIVGGGDPIENGLLNLAILNKYFSFKQNSSILDFGCGCGRLALPVLEQMNGKGRYVGVDIIHELVDFCRTEISSVYTNSEFYQLNASNSHYTKWMKNSGHTESELNDLSSFGTECFDVIVAFSVFTHLSSDDTNKYIQSLARLLRPGGKLLISAFLINSFTKKCIQQRVSAIIFDTQSSPGGGVYSANKLDQMAAVGFSETVLIDIASQHHLALTDIHYGRWSGRPSVSSFQDIVVLQKAAFLPKGFKADIYLSLNSDLPWDSKSAEGLRAAEVHYLHHGYYECRRWQ